MARTVLPMKSLDQVVVLSEVAGGIGGMKSEVGHACPVMLNSEQCLFKITITSTIIVFYPCSGPGHCTSTAHSLSSSWHAPVLQHLSDHFTSSCLGRLCHPWFKLNWCSELEYCCYHEMQEFHALCFLVVVNLEVSGTACNVDQVIVQARKPDFFTYNMSLYEVVTPDGLMKPCHKASPGGLYCGGSAGMVEKALNVEGDDVLYVGNHIYTDAALAKLNFKCVLLIFWPLVKKPRGPEFSNAIVFWLKVCSVGQVGLCHLCMGTGPLQWRGGPKVLKFL